MDQSYTWRFSPLTGNPRGRPLDAKQVQHCVEYEFQSPDGESSRPATLCLQSCDQLGYMFQSPDGESSRPAENDND